MEWSGAGRDEMASGLRLRLRDCKIERDSIRKGRNQRKAEDNRVMANTEVDGTNRMDGRNRTDRFDDCHFVTGTMRDGPIQFNWIRIDSMSEEGWRI